MRSPWWLRPWRAVRVLRQANENQRDMIDRQAHVAESLRIALRAAHVQIEQLSAAPEELDAPDWVIMGRRDKNDEDGSKHLLVLGTDKPTHATWMRKVAGYMHPPGQSRPMIPVMQSTLTVVTDGEFTAIRCRNYKEGVSDLIGEWER